MLVWLLDWCAVLAGPDADASWLAPLGKITMRAALSAGVGFLLALAFGSRLIRWLRRRFREPIVTDSSRLRSLTRHKHATPTMGGLFIVAAMVGGVVVFGDLSNPYAIAALVLVLGLAAVGAVDDLAKLAGRGNGISPTAKLTGQTLVATIVALVLYRLHAPLGDGLRLAVPLAADGIWLGPWFVPLTVLVIVASSNAVNLADGLDGLAGGCVIFAAGALAVMAYVAGHAELAAYLDVAHVPRVGEMVVVTAAMMGGVLGFLWFNCHPAQVFMGDTGSLPLGGVLGLVAVAARQELLLIVVGGVFVVEAASVMIQIGWYKLTARRVFACAPLHHHFQFKGWPESRIVVRFWIAAAMCAVFGIAGMKVTLRERTSAAAARRGTASSTASTVRPTHADAATGLPTSSKASQVNQLRQTVSWMMRPQDTAPRVE